MSEKLEAYSFVGGGDTVTLLEQQHLMHDWGFISTGGGSLLTYFAEGTLPVLRVFEEKNAAVGVGRGVAAGINQRQAHEAAGVAQQQTHEAVPDDDGVSGK